MLSNPMGAGKPGNYYAQQFGAPGNVGMPLGGAGGYPAQGTRPRARSNVDMFPPQIVQTQGSNISKWQNDVQASAHEPQPTAIDQRGFREYSQPVQPTFPGGLAPEAPYNPGPRPDVDGMKLSKKDKKRILEDWQRDTEEYQKYQSGQQKPNKRARSQTRFSDYPDSGRENFAFPRSGHSSNANSDIERAMNKLSIGGLTAHGNAAAERHAQRGRRLSGGALGLSGSLGQQQQAQLQLQLQQQQLQQQQQQQQQQARGFQDRSRSRQPYDRIGMNNEPVSPTGYVPARGNPAEIRSGYVDPGQPTVVPIQNIQQQGPYVVDQGRSNRTRAYSQGYANEPEQVSPALYGQQIQKTPVMYGQQISQQQVLQQNPRTPGMYGQQILPQQNPQQNPRTPGMYGQQIAPQQIPQQNPRTPGMYGQQIPPQTQPPGMYGQTIQVGNAQYSASDFVPLQLGNIPIQAIPLGPVSNYANFPQPSPQPSPIDPTTGQQFALLGANAMGQAAPSYGSDSWSSGRRTTNIQDIMNAKTQNPYSSPQGYPAINPKTILTPAAPPKPIHTTNIANYVPAQPAVHARSKSEVPVSSAYQRPAEGPPSGYVVPNVQAEPTGAPSSSSSHGGATERRQVPSAYQQPGRLVTNNMEVVPNLTQPTGPGGFGSRPNHTRQPSYKAALRDAGPDRSDSAGQQEKAVVPVPMRQPHIRQGIPPFYPQVISFDLNSEHRSEQPLRFGRFVYDRDVTHEEWDLFTKKVLGIWKERDPAFNRYHHAVGKVTEVLLAWNYAFFNPRGMDVVLFKGNERRSGSFFGRVESNIEFLPEAGRVSDPESESDDDEENQYSYMSQRDPQFRAQLVAQKAHAREVRRNEAASRPLEAPHSLVVYPYPYPDPNASASGDESYR
ncbi:hypothetical protein FRC14_003836 [Serendipita sp. 396]|nr:hypothetical protein FRC14_003836 [Serendipita sp. 396]KAG8789441.1 hypothetical protein FRC15_008298 [Serendipita sp. 397]KAG8804673.1 hypothetical protein FRC16_003563 [Serendipita sp. 398]